MPCKYGSENCTKLTDSEHRRTYRHEGLPDFLVPCKYKEQCKDRSTEHLTKYRHPLNFYQKTQSEQIKIILNSLFYFIRYKTRNI